MKKIIINLQKSCKNIQSLPKDIDLIFWATETLSIFCKNAELTIRLVDKREMYILNYKYSGKNFCTNILSFPCEVPKKIPLPLLGDLVICRQVIEKEAKLQNKSLKSHWAHMIVHGSLHLLGYDHILYKNAKSMEYLETRIIKNFGYPSPYS